MQNISATVNRNHSIGKTDIDLRGLPPMLMTSVRPICLKKLCIEYKYLCHLAVD